MEANNTNDRGAEKNLESAEYRASLHGQVAARGEKLAPGCKDCHGTHDVLRCTSCHTAHLVLPHTDPRSSIAHRNVARTCMQCHVRIEQVHRKVIRGELWEKQPNAIPACVDCHSPHRARRVFYDQGMADKDCLSCHDCICCFGLKNKQYCIGNEQFDRETYERRRADLRVLTPSTIGALRKSLQALKMKLPHRHGQIVASEGCTGDMIFHSKNCTHSFDITDSEESRYLCFTPKGIHSHDCTYNAPGGVEWCYETCSTVGMRSMVTFLTWYIEDGYYSAECHHSANVFGCVGLKRKRYCILNKQYAKDEYEKIASRIIAHMRETGEWGEYFPIAASRYGYNETVAHEHFPLTKDEALRHGWPWYDEVESREHYRGPPITLPERITDIPDDICAHVLTCETTGKPYKLVPQELRFYREFGLPIPRKCPDQRHTDRMALRNPRRLWNRRCAKCTDPIETTYAPERPEIVYCEKCYLETVY